MEYSELVARLLEADQTAQSIAQEARSREENMEADLEKESEQLRQSLFAQAEEQLQAEASRIQQVTEQTLGSQDERRDEAMKRMERAYHKYGDNWVNTLFNHIVDGQA